MTLKTSRKALNANHSSEYILCAWSVAWVQKLGHSELDIVVIKRKRINKAKSMSPLKNYVREKERSFILYRMEILRLLHHCERMSAHDALVVELPCLMGFRCHECATLRIEHVYFERHECEVLDAKKHRLFPVPLNMLVARHIEEAANGRSEGYVIQNESSAWQGRDEPLTDTGLWYISRKYSEQINFYPSPSAYSPIVGRRFFILEYLRVNGMDNPLTIDTLRRIVRHSDPETFWKYIHQLIFDEDVKRFYRNFEESMIESLKRMQDMTKNRMEIKPCQ